MLTIKYSSQFKKDYRAIKKRGYDIRLFEEVLYMLSLEQPLPQKYRNHALIGNYKWHMECYITSDWLLIYMIKDGELVTWADTHKNTQRSFRQSLNLFHLKKKPGIGNCQLSVFSFVTADTNSRLKPIVQRETKAQSSLSVLTDSSIGF